MKNFFPKNLDKKNLDKAIPAWQGHAKDRQEIKFSLENFCNGTNNRREKMKTTRVATL